MKWHGVARRIEQQSAGENLSIISVSKRNISINGVTRNVISATSKKRALLAPLRRVVAVYDQYRKYKRRDVGMAARKYWA